MELTRGIVTFLLTDIESSVSLWEDDQAAMRGALRRHDEIIDQATTRHGGVLVRPRGEGDSRFAVFQMPGGAVAAAVEIQRALEREPWATSRPVRVRIGVHTGVADIRDRDYYGSSPNRCARLR